MKSRRMQFVVGILTILVLGVLYIFYASQSGAERAPTVVYTLPKSRQAVNTVSHTVDAPTSSVTSSKQHEENSGDRPLSPEELEEYYKLKEVVEAEDARRATRVKELEAENADLQARLKEISDGEQALNDLEEWVDSTFIPELKALKPSLEEFDYIDTVQDMFDFYSEEERAFYVSEISKFENLCDRFADRIVALSDQDREIFIDVFSKHWGENAEVVIGRVNARLGGGL